MRGRPWFEWMIVLLIWTVLLVPLWGLTHKKPVRDDALVSDSSARAQTRAWAVLRFAHLPLQFTVKQDHRVLWKSGPVSEKEQMMDLVLRGGEDRQEIRLEVTWPPDTGFSVVELSLTPEGREEQSESIWGTGALDEILVYEWRGEY